MAIEWVSKLCLYLMLLTVLWVYWPGTQGGLILDDFGSISPLEDLRGKPESIRDYLFADDAGPLGRPISVGLFALEFAFLGAEVGDLKRHSILLHLLNVCLLAWLTYGLFRWRRHSAASLLAITVAGVWALSPLQVSTVLYTVQRMAMLSTFFCLTALVSYVQFRTARTPLARGLWLGLCGFAALLAPFAKENGVLVWPILLLLEYFWLNLGNQTLARSTWGYRFLWGLLALSLLLFLVLVAYRLEWLVASYESRSFTITERSFGQSRAILTYAQGFFWPDLAQLGVFHDDFMLGDEAAPLIDLLCTAVVLSALGFVIAGSVAGRWRPLCFCIGAFLVAHLLESSVLALEAYFEHRNYFPSVFLALGLGLLIAELGRHGRLLQCGGLLWVAVLMVFLAFRTSFLVGVWSNELLLSIHHFSGHPGSARAASDLATRYALLGDYPRAKDLSSIAHENATTKKAARREGPGDLQLRNAALACIAGRSKLPEELPTVFAEEIHRPLGDTNNVEVLLRLTRERRCETFAWNELLLVLRTVYLVEPEAPRASAALYTALATLAYDRQALEDALGYALLALENNAEALLPRFVLLQSLVELGLFEEAAEIRDELVQLKDLGALNSGQRETLALYRAL